MVCSNSVFVVYLTIRFSPFRICSVNIMDSVLNCNVFVYLFHFIGGLNIYLFLIDLNVVGFIQKHTEIENEISIYENKINDLHALRQVILNNIHEIGKDNFEFLERHIIYSLI